MVEFLKRGNAPTLAYVKHEGSTDLPPLIFLGGFRSDMEGTKAIFLERKCIESGQSFIRFDYRGHGQSDGEFTQACISDWAQDAQDILNHCTSQPAILVGSSMGGWISLLTALKHPRQVQAIVGLAAAPDFTLWMEEGMSLVQKELFNTQKYFELPNDYGSPYIITKKLIEDGRQNILLDKKNEINMPVHLIQGKKDANVPWQTAKRIKSSLTSKDVQITYVDEADHRLSSPDQLRILDNVVKDMNKKI